MDKSTERLAAQFLDYLDERLKVQNARLFDAPDFARTLIKAERNELDTIRSKFVSLLKQEQADNSESEADQ